MLLLALEKIFANMQNFYMQNLHLRSSYNNINNASSIISYLHIYYIVYVIRNLSLLISIYIHIYYEGIYK